MNRMRSLLLLTAFGCLALLAQNAKSSPVSIEQESSSPLSRATHFFTDPELDWQTVASKPLAEGIHNRNYLYNVDNYELPVWARVDLRIGDIPSGKKWLFDLGNNFGGELTFYMLRDGKLVHQASMDSFESFSSRPYNHRRAMFPLALEPNSEVQLLLEIERVRTPIFLPELYTEESLIAPDRKTTWLQGIQAGLVLALMLYHLMLAGAIRDKTFLMYALYIGVSAVYNLTQQGFGYQYLWPEAPWFAVYAGGVGAFLPVLFAILFTVHFLGLPTLSRRLTRFFYGTFALIVILLGIRIAGPKVHSLVLIGLAMIVYLSFIGAGIYALRKGAIYARYFLLGWTVYCLALVNSILVAMGISTPFAAYSFAIAQLSFDAQVLLLALALAHRIRTLRASKLEAEADNRAKSAFLARMSHEIRTPLSGVLGMSELLGDRLKDKTDIYYNNIIRSSGTSLLTIINDILDYSKFTSGRMELEQIPFSIQRLAVDSLDIFKVRAAEKNIELIADLDVGLPPFVQGDPTRLKQVMLNFVSNAVKFTEAGQIVLSVKAVEPGSDMLTIAVTDSGEGIPADEQEKLFDAFSQANSATSREHGGTGLGLSICKQLAVLMDGEIGVESEPGQGSTFWITAHLPESEEAEPPVNLDRVRLDGYRLLIVEDNYTFASLLNTQATAWGMEARVARNGEEALAILRSCYEDGISFDLISLDLVMPKMDGLEAARNMQLDYRFNTIPRLLLTSATNFPSRQNLEAAGIKRVMEKPTLPADLLKVYKELLAKSQSQDADDLLEAPEHVQIAHLDILVVEDNTVNQMVIKGILQRLSQQPEIVADGEDAVERIIHQGKRYDLVLMDCEMKRMDGITATMQVREWEAGQNLFPTPIVALTAHAVQTQVDACREAGMNAYLTKPLEIAKLENLLKEHAKDNQLKDFDPPRATASSA